MGVYKTKSMLYVSKTYSEFVMIRHRPLFDVENVIQHYTEKDGVPIKYVCTSAPNTHAAYAADIFYRETPHPEFGNRYFGLYTNGLHFDKPTVMITNADNIENLDFEMVVAGGEWHYSQHRHDFYSVGPVSIDGGRSYFRMVGDVHNVLRKCFKVKDGEFVEVKDE